MRIGASAELPGGPGWGKWHLLGGGAAKSGGEGKAWDLRRPNFGVTEKVLEGGSGLSCAVMPVCEKTCTICEGCRVREGILATITPGTMSAQPRF